MATVVDAKAGESDNSTNLVIVSAPDHVDGDIIIQFIGYADNTVDSVSNGLANEEVFVNDGAGFDTFVQVAWQTASSEPAVYSVSCDDAATDHTVIIMAAIRGLDDSPFDIAYASATHYNKEVNTNSPTANAITASADGDLALVFQYCTHSNITDMIPPSGYTEAVQNLGNHKNAILAYTSVNSGVETPGTQAHTGMSGVEEAVSLTFLLRSQADKIVSVDPESMLFTGHPVSVDRCIPVDPAAALFTGNELTLDLCIPVDQESVLFTGLSVTYLDTAPTFDGTWTIGERVTITNDPIVDRVRFI